VARLSTIGVRIAWQVLHPRRAAFAGRVAAVESRRDARMITVPAAAPASSVDPHLVEAWRSDLDDLADLAASFADPADAETASQRRAAFSADAVARRLSAALQSQDGD